MSCTTDHKGGIPEKFRIWVSDCRNVFRFIASETSWVLACVCTGQTCLVPQGSEEKGPLGGSCVQAPATHSLGNGRRIRGRSALEAINRSKNRMETKWERL